MSGREYGKVRYMGVGSEEDLQIEERTRQKMGWVYGGLI